MGVCVHYDGFVYDKYSLTLQPWGQRAAGEQLLVEEAQMVQQTKPFTSEQTEKFEREKQRFKYNCCNQTVQTSDGCKKGKHSPENMTQNDCDHNREYQGRRLPKV